MIVIDHDNNTIIYWKTNYYQWKQKEAPKLAVEGNRFCTGPSSPPPCFLSWHGD